MALFKIMGVEFCHLPTDAQVLKYYLEALSQEYLTNPAGGVSAKLFHNMMEAFRICFTSMSKGKKKEVVSVIMLNRKCWLTACEIVGPSTTGP
jgi:hypothetical protein